MRPLLLAFLTFVTSHAQTPDREEIRRIVRDVLQGVPSSDAVSPSRDTIAALVREELRAMVRSEVRAVLSSDDVADVVSDVIRRDVLDRELERHVSRLIDGAARTRHDPSSVRVSGLLQFRYTGNDRRDAGPRHGFSLPRARLAFDADVTERLRVHFRGGFTGLQQVRTGFEERNGEFTLENAYARYAFDCGLNLRIGQFSIPLARESDFGAAQILGVDYSVIDGRLGPGKSKAVQLSEQGDVFRWWASVGSGLRTPNTGFSSSENADYALSFRGEGRLAGDDWDPFADATSWRGSPFAVLVGVGLHYESGARISPDDPEFDLFFAVADASFEGDGWNAMVAFYWLHSNISAARHVDDLAALVQAGLFVAADLEIFARFEWLSPDDDRGRDDFHAFAIGFNLYLVPGTHTQRVSVDLQYFFDAPNDSIVFTSKNLALLSSDDGGQWAVRFQYQLLF